MKERRILLNDTKSTVNDNAASAEAWQNDYEC
jgi:hypothetical protein